MSEEKTNPRIVVIDNLVAAINDFLAYRWSLPNTKIERSLTYTSGLLSQLRAKEKP